MKITSLAQKVCSLEGGKVNLSIAQVLEVLRCINRITVGAFYKWVRTL